MTNPKKQPAQRTERTSAIPGIISAGVVLVIFGLIIGLLINRANSQTATGSTNEAAIDATSASTAESATLGQGTNADTATQALADNASAATPVAEASTQGPPPMTIDPTQKYTATITTPRGDIVIELLPEIAPQAVNNFVTLAREGFYDGLTWHRVIAGFMAQGGDPLGTGAGGPGYTVPAEFTDKILFDQPGIVATARRSDQTDSSGSQFFITTAPAQHLDEQYTIFGRVIEGQDIVDNIPLRDPATAPQPGEEIVKLTISEGEKS